MGTGYGTMVWWCAVWLALQSLDINKGVATSSSSMNKSGVLEIFLGHCKVKANELFGNT